MTAAVVSTVAMVGLVACGIGLIQVDGRSNQALVATGVILSVTSALGAMVCLLWLAIEIQKLVNP